MTVPGAGDTHFKKGQGSLRSSSRSSSSPSLPVISGSVTIPVTLGAISNACVHSLASSMIQSPTRAIVKTLLKTLLQILLKLWKWASSFVLVIFLAAWFYGGFLPYLLFFVALMSLGYHVSDYLLYQPDFPLESRIFVPAPDQHGLPYEELWLQTKDRVKLHGYLIKQKLPNNRHLPTIIFFHGNAGNIGNRIENAKMMYHELKCHILLVEYRGYGHSEGTPSEKGLYMDAQAAFELIDAREDLDSSKIILFGRSLGGAVGIDLASRCDFRDRVAALIIENSFTNIPGIAKHLFPVRAIRWLPKFCYKNRYESQQKITSVVAPTLFICGTDDEMIPQSMMTELYNKCSSPLKRLLRFPGGHNDTWQCKDYTAKINEFITEAVLVGNKGTQYYTDNIV